MKILTFDCYNTLVDTSTADSVLEDIARRHGLDSKALEFREAFYCLEHELMYAAPFRSLKEILALSVAQTLEKYQKASTQEDAQVLIECYRAFQPFADVPDALEALASKFELYIMSNSDNDILTNNVKTLGVRFKHLFTAESLRCYKPTLQFFQHVHAFLELPGNNHTHIAAGFWWDVMPAKALNWRRVWVNSRNQTGDEQYQPYIEIQDFRDVLTVVGN